MKTNVLYDYTVPLWSPSSSKRRPQVPSAAGGDAALLIGDIPHSDFPFNISIPPSSAGGCSSCHLQSYRVYWRLEASEFCSNSSVPFIIDNEIFADIHGLQVPGYGSRLTKHYDVAITRYNSPTTSILPSPSSPSTFSHGPGPSSSTHSSSTPQAYIAHTIPITTHPHILALTTYRPRQAIGPLEDFPVTVALTVRGKPSTGSLPYSKERSQHSISSSPLSSSPTAFLNGGYREGGAMPLKVVASVKRIVELFDDDTSTTTATASSASSPSSSKKTKSSSIVPPPPPVSVPVPFIRESLSPPPKGSFGFGPKTKYVKQTRRPPTAPGPGPAAAGNTGGVGGGLTVLEDKHSRHRSLTTDMERRIASNSIRAGGGPPAAGGLAVPLPYANVRERRASPEGTLVASSSTSASSSDAESVVAYEEDDDDGEEDTEVRGDVIDGDRSFEKDGLVSVPMDLDGIPAYHHAPSPPTAVPAKPGAIASTGPSSASGGGGGAFSLFEKHFPWAYSSSSSSPSPSAGADGTIGISDDLAGVGGGAKKGKGRDKKTLFQESATFPRVPLGPSAQLSFHAGNSNGRGRSSTETLVPPPYPTTSTTYDYASPSPHLHNSTTLAIDVPAGNGMAIPYSHPGRTATAADTYATTLTLKIPTPKSAYHWGVGETLRTGLARVRFVIGYKVRILFFFY